MLKDAKASARTLQLAEQFECDVCLQHGRRAPARPSAVAPVTEPWDTISVDTFWWASPVKNSRNEPLEHCVGISFFDEATDFQVCTVVRRGPQPQKVVTGEEFKKAFSETWLRILPKPRVIRYDAEGFLRGLAVLQWMESQCIKLQAIAGEAPWQGGKQSRHLATVKENMTLLAEESGPSVTVDELLDLTVAAKNECHAIRGYSPNQWSFGCGHDRLESFLQNEHQLPLQCERLSNLTFEEQLQRRNAAKIIFLKSDARRRVQRAVLFRRRKEQVFQTGQLVYFFRRGRGHGTRCESRWYGPAQVVCVEKTGDPERNQTQGSVVWVAHGTTMYRCAPEQLRPVTHDLRRMHELFGGSRSPSDVMKDARSDQRYFDIRREVEEMMPDEDVVAEDPDEHVELLRRAGSSDNPSRYRLSGKSDPRLLHGRIQEGSADPASPDEQRGLNGSAGGDQFPRADLRENEPPGSQPDGPERYHQAQGQDLGGDPENRPRVHRLGTPASASESPIPGPDHLCATPRGKPRPVTGEGPSGPGTEAGAISQEAVEEFRRHADEHRHRPERDVGASAPEAGLPERELDVHSWRGPDVGPAHPAAAEPQPAVAGEHHGPPEPRGGSGPPPQGSGDPEVNRRHRSRSRHRHVLSAMSVREDSEDSDTDMFPVGCVLERNKPKASDQPREVQGGCFSWMSRESLGCPVTDAWVGFSQPADVCEIILNVAPRDVHAKRRNGVTDWILNQKPKKNAEVRMRKLGPEDQAAFKVAMKKELDSFLEREAVSIASRAGIDQQKLLNMRWVLTWKPGDVEGSRKAKARLIIRGFEDPNLLHVKRDSPTLAVQSRNSLLALCALNHWPVSAGDIKTAFLNGDEMPEKDQLFGDPPVEAREILGMSEDEVLRIRKVIYGLLHAPRAWYDKLSRTLEGQGWERSKLEPCVWRLFSDEGKLIGLIGCHVDDILTGGESEHYYEKIRTLKNSFPFGSWQNAQEEHITFCGCEIHQALDYSITLSQERYALGVSEIPVSNQRKQQPEAKATPAEVKQLRGTLGALSWRATQSCPWLAATTSILQGTQKDPLVSDLMEANKLVRMQRQHCESSLTFKSNIRRPILVTYTDASYSCRRDLSSQGGQFTVLADACVLDGERSDFSPLNWQSRKLARVARSSTSAEVRCAETP